MSDKRRHAQNRIAALEQEKNTAGTALAAAQKAFRESDADPLDTDSEPFKSLDTAGTAYDTAVEQLDHARKAFAAFSQHIGEPATGENGPAAQTPTATPHGLKTLAQQLKSGEFEGFSQRLEHSEEYKQLRDSGIFTSQAKFGGRLELMREFMSREETKALIGFGDLAIGLGNLVTPDRAELVSPNTRALRVSALISKGTTSSTSIDLPIETVIYDDAAFVPDPVTEMPIGSGDPPVTEQQAGLKPKTKLSFDLNNFPVRTVAVWMPVHRNAFDDVPQLRSHIDTSLGGQIDRKVDLSLLSGSGQNDEFKGILNTSGIGALTASSGVEWLEGIHKAITQIRIVEEEPNAIVLHPLDWERIRLQRESLVAQTIDPESPQELITTGGYMFGPPSQSGVPTLWGFTPVVTTAIAEGTALVGDYTQAMMWIRSGVRLFATDSHEDYFGRNLVAVLAEFRAAFGVRKPQAFCTVTMDD
jgi:HK97 family phage major capsid protein